MEKDKAILLFSGGLDSTVLLFWLLNKGYDVYPLYINYGQKSSEGEYRAIRKILDNISNNNLLVLELPALKYIGTGSLIGEYPQNVSSLTEWHESEFFASRNLILLSIASAYGYKIKANNLAIGVVGKSYKDTSKAFLDGFNTVLDQSLGKFNIIAPFAELDRIKVVQEAVRLLVPINDTFSCNAIGNRHCNLCTSCYEREEALRLYKELLATPSPNTTLPQGRG